jgi:transcriptional regulator with XRE-family HTH domain
MEKNFLVEFGKRIHTLRELTNTTQEDLRKALGFTSTGAISQVENGTKGMKFEAVLKSASFFGIHPMLLISNGNLSKSDLEVMIKTMEILKQKDTNKHYRELLHLMK